MKVLLRNAVIFAQMSFGPVPKILDLIYVIATVFPRIFRETINPSRKSQRRADITYGRTEEGRLYPAVATDLLSRKQLAGRHRIESTTDLLKTLYQKSWKRESLSPIYRSVRIGEVKTGKGNSNYFEVSEIFLFAGKDPEEIENTVDAAQSGSYRTWLSAHLSEDDLGTFTFPVTVVEPEVEPKSYCSIVSNDICMI